MRAVFDVRKGERAIAALAIVWFFAVIACNYVVRPIRETVGTRADDSRLSWLYMGTFVASLAVNPIYAWLVARARRRTFVLAVYSFFAVNLIAFGAISALRDEALFIWLSVFNLFAVTTFWGLLADVFARESAKRVFGLLAAGGTAGAIVGSLVTDYGIKTLGVPALLGVAAVLLVLAGLCAVLVLTIAGRARADLRENVSGSILEGWRAAASSPYLRTICGYLLLFTCTATFVYFAQNELVKTTIADPAERTRYFARVNLVANVLSALIQVFLSGWLLRRFSIGKNLNALPVLCLLGFFALAGAPVLPVIACFETLRRTAHFAVSKPAQEVLFTVVERAQKYKAKSFIDTVVYRGGDVIAAWTYYWLNRGLGIDGAAYAGGALCIAWIAVGATLGRRHDAPFARAAPERDAMGSG